VCAPAGEEAQLVPKTTTFLGDTAALFGRKRLHRRLRQMLPEMERTANCNGMQTSKSLVSNTLGMKAHPKMVKLINPNIKLFLLINLLFCFLVGKNGPGFIDRNMSWYSENNLSHNESSGNGILFLKFTIWTSFNLSFENYRG